MNEINVNCKLYITVDLTPIIYRKMMWEEEQVQKNNGRQLMGRPFSWFNCAVRQHEKQLKFLEKM